MDLVLSFPEQLSTHMRSLRRAQGMTQTQMASRMGVTQSRIAAIEKNAASMSLEQLHRALSALDTELVLRPRGKETPPLPPASAGKAKAKATRTKAPGNPGRIGRLAPPAKSTWPKTGNKGAW